MYHSGMSSYLKQYLETGNRKEVVNRAFNALRRNQVEFDTIAVTGVSGLIIGAPLANLLEKDLLVIRKSIDGTHSSELVEGWGRNQKILLVDDMVAEGHTLQRMREMINDRCDNPEIVGVYLY